jgi:quercetin dioxygenase-like cupin family protein
MNARVVRGADVAAVPQDWGSLQWLVGGAQDEGCGMTLGRVTFKPGESNPAHVHPNCSEILFVVSGRIEHSVPGEAPVLLNQGDCIVLPEGEKHNARSVGDDDAVVIVAFNSAYRATVGE